MRTTADATTAAGDTDEAALLAETLIADLHANSAANLEQVLLIAGGSGTISADRMRSIYEDSFKKELLAISSYQRSNDVEALRLHMEHAPSSLGPDSRFSRNSLQLLISDLRASGCTGLESIIDADMLNRFGDMKQMIVMERVNKETAFTEIERSPEQHEIMATALRTAAALGAAEVTDYISSDYNRAMELASQNDITHYTDMIALVEDRLGK